jgi:Mg-chelatase subunit ChlD
MVRFRWIFLFVLYCAPVLRAEENSCTERTVIIALRHRHTRSVPYTVQVADFRVKVNGKPVKIAGATKASGSARVVIVLDASGSMSPEPKWQAAEGIASEVIRRSPEATQFALIVFANKVLKTTKFGPSQREVLGEISHLSVPRGGGTAMRDAIFEAARLLQPAREGDSVLVISDGGDNRSKVSNNLLQNTFLSQGLRIFSARFIDPEFTTAESASGAEEFGSLAETTGGAVRDFNGPGFATIGVDFATEISNYNMLHIVLERPVRNPASLQLELMDLSGKRRKDLDLIYPQKLLPCTTLSAAP